MPESGQSPNPLRPYYIPPSIGKSTDAASNATTGLSKPSPTSSFAFPDIDYSEYISEASPSVIGSVKSVVDQALWKYASVLLAQPFEVAKLILQVRVAQDEDDVKEEKNSYSGEESGRAAFGHEDSSDDEPNYFTSTTPFDQQFPSVSSPLRGRRGRPSRADSPTPPRRPQHSPSRLELKNPHSLLDALSALSSSGGALSMWRATNSTVVYNVLSRTLETFFRSFLAAIFGIAENDIFVPASSGSIPDPSILASTSPTATVLITTAAAALSALVLAPIDAARTRLIVTPSKQEPRTLLGTLRTLPTAYLIPSHLIPITFFTSTLPTFISSSTPFFLKSYLGLDPVINPASWSIATFAGSALDLAVKFPLETVLRRAQIATWTAPATSPPSSSSKRKAVTTIVPVPQSYRGILPTMWSITREEGFSESHKDRTAALMGKAPRRRRRGQGIEGLYRGWRVGLWGLVGVWGTAFVGGLQGGPEAATDRVHAGKF